MTTDPNKAQSQAGGNAPGPDVMLGLWASWMDQMSAPAQASGGDGKPWWQMTTNIPAAPDVLAGGVKQLEEGLAKDPTLRSIDQMWNANPLREVVPIDWAEIARALRTVWLRSLRKPETGQGRAGLQPGSLALCAPGLAGGWAALAGHSRLDSDERAGVRLGRQAVRRARVAHEPRLPHPQGGLPPRVRLADEAGRRGGRHGRGRAAAHQLPSASVRGRHEPDPDADVEPRRPPQGDRDRRSQRRGRRPQPRWPTSTPGVSAWSTRRPSRRGATSRSRPARWSTATA